ncbi:MAG: 3'-5' exonuclease [Pyrinomonadaceae bacterium]
MTKRVITIDIETLPAAQPFEDDCAQKASGKFEDDRSKTALSGDFGRILCIGYAVDAVAGERSAKVIGWDEEASEFTCHETSMLEEFWEVMRGFRPDRDRIVGHNIFDFDLKFIYKRSIIHGVRPTMVRACRRLALSRCLIFSSDVSA